MKMKQTEIIEAEYLNLRKIFYCMFGSNIHRVLYIWLEILLFVEYNEGLFRKLLFNFFNLKNILSKQNINIPYKKMIRKIDDRLLNNTF